MAHHSGDFDATLVAAAGDDLVLLAQLRAAFVDSLAQHLDLLRRSRCDGNWQVAAQRLKGLAACFHAGELAELAQEAIAGAPGDPRVLRKLTALHARLAAPSYS
jgi:hypothetical protein